MEEENKKSKKTRVLKFAGAFLVVAGLVLLVTKYKHFLVSARVGDKFIFRYQLNKKLAESYGEAVLEDLITLKLAENELGKYGITVAQEEVDREIAAIEEGLDGITLEEALGSQGMTEKELREQVEFRLRLEKHLADRVEATSEEVEELLEMYASQFPPEMTDAEKKEEAVEILINQKMQTIVNEWLAELKEGAEIVKYL